MFKVYFISFPTSYFIEKRIRCSSLAFFSKQQSRQSFNLYRDCYIPEQTHPSHW